MNNAVPGGHPPQDVLADLAAEVLSVEQARDVEAHVMRCRECEQMLVDAERVRALLAGPRPGPMPADVWNRIESSFAAEAAARGRNATGPGSSGGVGTSSTRGWFDSPELSASTATPYALPSAVPPQVPSPSPAPASAPLPPPPFAGSPVTAPALPGSQGGSRGRSADRTDGSRGTAPDTGSMFLPKDGAPSVPLPPPDMSFDEAPTAAWRLFLNEPEPEPPSDPVQHKVGRAVRSMRSRRDVRTENEKVPTWRRPGVVTAVAAAGIAVLGLSGLGLAKVLGGDDRDGMAAPAALPGASGRGLVVNSGAEYTASTLAAQVKALVKNGSPISTRTSAAKGTPDSSAAKTSSPGAVGSPSVRPGTVADPKHLQSCLAALGEADRKPIVVDLARYQGREAAVIVLPGVTSGYEVWVVARDCRPGAEGHLAYKLVQG